MKRPPPEAFDGVIGFMYCFSRYMQYSTCVIFEVWHGRLCSHPHSADTQLSQSKWRNPPCYGWESVIQTLHLLCTSHTIIYQVWHARAAAIDRLLCKYVRCGFCLIILQLTFLLVAALVLVALAIIALDLVGVPDGLVLAGALEVGAVFLCCKVT